MSMMVRAMAFLTGQVAPPKMHRTVLRQLQYAAGGKRPFSAFNRSSDQGETADGYPRPRLEQTLQGLRGGAVRSVWSLLPLPREFRNTALSDDGPTAGAV